MVTRHLAALVVMMALAGCQAREAIPPPPGPAADSTVVRDVLRRYYAAIEARDYPAAYTLWSRGGEASGQSYTQFAAGFAQTARSRVEFTGPVTFGAAAGTIYATVPVRVRATTTAGEEQVFAGDYTLRRANDVPGATPDQLRWHLHDARLVPEPR